MVVIEPLGFLNVGDMEKNQMQKELKKFVENQIRGILGNENLYAIKQEKNDGFEDKFGIFPFYI